MRMRIVFDGQTGIRTLKELPETPGVYFFLGKKKEILYIGKATVLRDRARSYFSSDIMESRGPKIAKMLEAAGVALPAGHPLATREAVRMSDLRNVPFIGADERDLPGFNAWLRSLARRAGFRPRILLDSESLTHGLAAVVTEGAALVLPDYARQARLVVSTAGVRGIVAFGALPPPVPDAVVEGLRREIAGQAGAAAAPILREGAWVRVLAGCFRFLEGRMVQVDPRSDRVRVLLDLLGGEVHVTLPAHQVAPLGEATRRYPSGLLHSAAAPVLRRAG